MTTHLHPHRCFFSGIFPRVIGTVRAARGIHREGGRVTIRGFVRTLWVVVTHPPKPRAADSATAGGLIGQPNLPNIGDRSAGQTKVHISGIFPDAAVASPIGGGEAAGRSPPLQPHPGSVAAPGSTDPTSGARLTGAPVGVLYLEYSPPPVTPSYNRNIRRLEA